jgi:cholesterol oxidase
MKRKGRLSDLSEKLGYGWCGNGDLEGTVILPEPNGHPTNGPVIATTIQYRFADYPDSFPHGMLIQEGGFPSFLAWYFAGKVPSLSPIWNGLRLGMRFLKQATLRLPLLNKIDRHPQEINIGDDVAGLLDKDTLVRRTLMLLGMGRDRSDGRIVLRDDGKPIVKWRIDASRLHYKRLRREMKKIATALGGRYLDSPLTYMDKVIAVHNLGGCVMADDAEGGVVNSFGEVFGYSGLYVVDGSIIPTSLGPNPSLTISAVAERIAENFELD